jgi:type IV secretion system protein VirB5
MSGESFMIKKIIVLSVLAISIQAFAMPVSDVGEWTRTMQVVSQLREQYQTLKDQYSTLTQQYGAMTGNSGWGGWQNSDGVV